MKNPIQKIVVLALGLTALTLNASIFTGPPDNSGGGGGGGAPTGPAGGVLAGTYPNPVAANGAPITNGVFTTPTILTIPSGTQQIGGPSMAAGSSGSGTVNTPQWLLSGNPGEALPANAGADYALTMISLNPFARGGYQIGTTTTNPADWIGGAIITNTDGYRVGVKSFNDAAFMMENMQGVADNGPGIANIVNNGAQFMISSSQSVGGVTADYPFMYTYNGVTHWPSWVAHLTNTLTFSTNQEAMVITNNSENTGFGNGGVRRDWHFGGLLYGLGNAQLTKTNGAGTTSFLNAGAFDSTQTGTVPLDSTTINALSFQAQTPTLTKTSFDIFGNGTGMASTNSTFDLYLQRAGVKKMQIQAAEIDVMVPNIYVSNIFVTNATSGVLGTLAAASTTNLVVDFNSPDEQSITLTANANMIQSTNRTAAVWNRHTVWLYPNGTNRTVTFNSSWHTNGFFSTTITLTNTTVASVVFACNGSAETNVFAVYTTWP